MATRQNTTLSVVGMTCGSCVRSIEDRIGTLPGVASISVSLSDNRAFIAHDPTAITPAALAAAVDDMGFEAAVIAGEPAPALVVSPSGGAPSSETSSFHTAVSSLSQASGNRDGTVASASAMSTASSVAVIDIVGMTCNSCVRSIEDKIATVAGVARITVSLADAQANVVYNASVVSAQAIAEAIDDMGFDAAVASESQAATPPAAPAARSVSGSTPSTTPTLTPSSAAPLSTLTSATIAIVGMTCNSCVRGIEDKIGAVPGVHAIRVSLADNNAVVELDLAHTTPAAIAEAIDDMGFDAAVVESVPLASVPLAVASPSAPPGGLRTTHLLMASTASSESVRRAVAGVRRVPGVGAVVRRGRELVVEHNDALVAMRELVTLCRDFGLQVDLNLGATTVSATPATTATTAAARGKEGTGPTVEELGNGKAKRVFHVATTAVGSAVGDSAEAGKVETVTFRVTGMLSLWCSDCCA